jgi:glycosyltransferase involved in cell wall biosynthesis
MKVLFIANAFDRPESHLVAKLIARGVQAQILVGEVGKYFDVLASQQAIISSVSLSSRIDIIGIKKIRQVIKDFQPDIIHSFSARGLSNALIASWGRALKHVAYRGTMGNLSRWDPSSWMSFLNPRLDKIVCVSDAVRSDLIRFGIVPKKLVRIYKGHNPEWYQATDSKDLTEFGLSHGEPVIACVANSRPVKGIDILIRAFRLIPVTVKAQLLLIGEVRDPSLLKLAQGDARIHFTGFRKDAPAIVAACNIFCMPSRRREGFPKALIEAMIQGLPAVVSDVGGLPEIVKHNQNGLVVAADDIVMLSQALMRLIKEPELCTVFGQRARTDIIENFSIDQTIEQTFAVYQDLLRSAI